MGHFELLDAIARSPDDDGPRLVYADALSTENDPFGELIVLSQRLHSMTTWREARSVDAERFRQREGDLIGALATRMKLAREVLHFDRGFVRTLAIDGVHGFDVAAKDPAMHIVDGLRFTLTSNIDEFVACPIAPKIRRLEWLADAAGIEQLSQVTTLTDVTVSVRTLKTIASLPLERLVLDSTNRDDLRTTLEWLIGVDLPKLHTLVVRSRDGLDTELVELLVGARVLPQLKELSINAWDDEAPAAFRRHKKAFEHVRLLPSRYADTTRTRRALDGVPLGLALLEMGRIEEATRFLYDGHLVEWDRADVREGLRRCGVDVEDSHPYDAEIESVLGLFNWAVRTRPQSQARTLDRILAVAPDHAGAWAERGQMLLDDYDPDAGPAIARAITLEPFHLGFAAGDEGGDISALATAHAVLSDDPESALDVLKDKHWPSEALHTHAAVLTAIARIAMQDIKDARKTLEALEDRATCPRTFAYATFVRGLVDYHARDAEHADQLWRRNLGKMFGGHGEPDPYCQIEVELLGRTAGVLLFRQYPHRSVLGGERPLRPIPGLLFRQVLRRVELTRPSMKRDLEQCWIFADNAATMSPPIAIGGT